jgi:prepilin-type N-terminal cleavage/methylation domain-containing protein
MLTPTRRGVTLLELMVAIALSAIVLGSATASLLRQQRTAAAQSARREAESQNRAGLLALPAMLAGLSPAVGDLAPGEARDTALQVRAELLNGFACDSSASRVILAAADTGGASLTGVASLPQAGDTLWWYPTGESAWAVRRVTGVDAVAGVCGLVGQGTRSLVRIAFAGADTVPRGAPVRLTRQMRFSVYRAGDGSWQLGTSEWSEVLQRFAPPQPIAGPFLRSGPGGPRTGFRYFDATGAELSTLAQSAVVAQVARIRVTVLSPERSAGSQAGATRSDSADVALARALAP